jgi:hypothetical protein
MAIRHTRETALAAFAVAVVLLGSGAELSVTRAQAPQPRLLDIVGHIGGAPSDVALEGTHAYVASGHAMEVWDVSDPYQPVRVGELPRPAATPGNGGPGRQRLHVEGGTALLVDRNSVRIIDLTDPAAPRELGAYRLPGTAVLDAARLGTWLYVATSLSGWGITVVDISNPAAPRDIGYTRDGDYTRLAVADGLLFAFTTRSTEPPGERGLRVFDLGNPAAPVEVSFSEGVTAPYDMVIADHRLYVAGNAGVRIYSVGDPTAVRFAGTIDTADPVDAVAVVDKRAYLHRGGVLESVDVADAANPVRTDRLQIVASGRRLEAGWAGLAAVEGMVVAAVHRSGTFVVDTPANGSMRRAAAVGTELPGSLHGVAIAGNSAYVLTGHRMAELDLSDVQHPFVRATLESDSALFTHIAVHGTTLCLLASTDDGRIELSVLDVGVAGAPDRRAAIDLGTGAPAALAVVGTYAFAATTQWQDLTQPVYEWRVDVVDIGRPAAPRVVSDLKLSQGWAAASGDPALALAGTRMLVGSYHGMSVYDISDPTHPRAVGSLPLWFDRVVAVAGTADRAYLAIRSSVPGDQDNLAVVDIVEPTNPAFAARLSSRYAPTSLALSPRHLYAGGFEGIQAFATDGPGLPAPVARRPLPGWARAIALHDGHAVVADDDAGLFVLHTGDPDLPVIVPPTPAPASPVPTVPATPMAPPAPEPAVDCICRGVLRQVPPAVVADAVANPDRVRGWRLPLNPNTPVGPGNPLRTCLALARPSVPYHPVWNTVTWKVGCP